MLITYRNVVFFLISSLVLGLFDQLKIFWQLYLIELLGLLTGLELLELWHLIYPRLLTGFGMLVFFTNLSLMEFQVRYLALFLLFSVIDSFKWFWMGSLHKNIQLMLEFLKVPFLFLHFSYYTLMSPLMIFFWYCYLCWWYYSLFSVRSGIPLFLLNSPFFANPFK